ncbi:MAG: OmpA family protein, partial [Myxococcales bacterium]|nr:OmpA family protein [Myxococcales bacterium]
GDLCEDDDDGDGVPRTDDAPCVTGVTAGCSDNCPEIPNVEQTDTDGDGDGDACDTDDDDDGVLDGEDNCPIAANPTQADGDADGLGDACDTPGPTDDRDADGVVDDVDNCPDDANERQDDLDDDGVGDTCDPDGDGDGVLDTVDNCHGVPNADQADWDGDGVGEACQGVGLGVTGGACSTSVGSLERRSTGWLALLLVGLGCWFWRRRRGVSLGVALLLALGTATPDASAQTGGAVSTFHPSPFMQDLITVQKATTRKSGSWNVGMLLEYQRNPLVLRDIASDEIVRKIVSDTVFAHVRGAYAVTDWCDLGLVLPIIAFQAGDGLGGGAEPGVAGIGDLEVAVRFRLFQTDDRRFALALTPTLTAPTGRLVDESMGSPSVTFTPWVGLSYDLPVFGVAFGLGYRVMKDSTIADLALEDELLFRLGISVPVSDSVVILAEVDGGTAATSPFADAGRTPVEARAGVRVLAAPSFSVDVGAGAGLTQGYASPDFRVYAGFNFFREPPGDRDGDGLMDEDDACPDDPEDRDGLEDGDGCPEPDNDRDGICDPWVAERPASAPTITVCRGSDRCPESPEDVDGFEDENGCPDPDNDKDGIPDTKDACALESEDVDGTLDDDGCPDPDDDADGICDGWVLERQQQAAYEALCKGVDKCPKVAETVNEIEDDDGCPDELAHVEGNKIIIKDKIYFFYGKAVIMPKSDPVLAAVLKIMNTNPQIKRVRIEGHTDTRGPAGRNKALSASRAKAVLTYLVKRGVSKGRLISEGFGESTPIVPAEKTEEEFELNRRVEFTILDE